MTNNTSETSDSSSGSGSGGRVRSEPSSALSAHIERIRRALVCVRPWEQCRHHRREGALRGSFSYVGGEEFGREEDSEDRDYDDFYDCMSHQSEADRDERGGMSYDRDDDDDGYGYGPDPLGTYARPPGCARPSDRSPVVDATDRDLEIASYSPETRCVVYPSDGSPSHVPPGRCSARTPPEYSAACSGNMDGARKMWEDTIRWREEMSVWNVHARTDGGVGGGRGSRYGEIRDAYPHYLHGYARLGGEEGGPLPVMWERTGKLKLGALFGREGEGGGGGGCAMDDLIEQCVFNTEYIANVACGFGSSSSGGSSWGYVAVMDFDGFSPSCLTPDVLRYLSRAGSISASHYPGSLRKVLLINAPVWMSGAWNAARRMLPRGVVEAVTIASYDYMATLTEFIDGGEIPKEYGGESPYPLGDHPLEVGLRELATGGRTVAASQVAGDGADSGGSTSVIPGQ